MMTHHRITKDGKALGRLTAMLEQRGSAILQAAGLQGVPLPRVRGEMCPSCACRPGTVPNGCEQTQLDLLKAVVEGVPFFCHAPNNGDLCQGWLHARAVHAATPLPKGVQDLVGAWEFSPPDPVEDDRPAARQEQLP